jgi:dienelactone hydrolase
MRVPLGVAFAIALSTIVAGGCQSVLDYGSVQFGTDAGEESLEGSGGEGGNSQGGSSQGGASQGGSSSGGTSQGGASQGGSSQGGASQGGSSQGGSSAGGASQGGAGGAGGGQLGPLTPGQTTLTLTVAGKSRTAILRVPNAVNQGAVPLVIALHGNGDTSANFIASMGFAALADQDGFVLVAPQGVTQSFTYMGQPLNGIDWDAYRPVSGGNIDVPLLDEIRNQLVATGSIDVKRIMVFGYSQGGYLSFRYGMDAAAALSCTAVGAAANPLPGSSLVSGAPRKIPVAIQIGTNDWNIGGAQSTKTELEQNGNPLLYNEIPGAGHVPFPGDPKVPLDWCRGQALP